MILDKLKLDGKVCVVTGASRGIGRGMALALGEAGGNVILVSRNAAALEKVAGEIRSTGRKADVIEADVGRPQERGMIVERVTGAYGRLDVLVNNAGMNIRMPSEDYTEEAWDNVINVNLKAAFFLCQAAARVMIKQGKGKIINTASLTSFIGISHIPAYVASKGAINQLTKSLGVEWTKYNINVNAIAPGYIITEMTQPLKDDPKRRSVIESRIPMNRWGVPEDLAGAAVFLASEASDYITGQTIIVDGGWMAGFSWDQVPKLYT